MTSSASQAKKETSENITTPEGFKTATTLVIRLTVGALLWSVHVCASWAFMHAAKCKRSINNSYEGDGSYPPPPLDKIQHHGTSHCVLCVDCSVQGSTCRFR